MGLLDGKVAVITGAGSDMAKASTEVFVARGREGRARLLGIPEHRIRVVMRDTGGGFGQKVMVRRDEMCLMFAAPKVGAAAQVGGRPEGEPARRGQVAPGARHRDDGLRCRRHDPGRVPREVDVETGRVMLLRYIVSEDCGPMINPDVVEGQIAGRVVQGIGGVLYEHLAYDDDGNPLATTFVDYLVPSAAEVPPIEFGHVASPSPGPGGFKGVGEGGAIGAPPAVVNAVARRARAVRCDVDAPSPQPVSDRQAPGRR